MRYGKYSAIKWPEAYSVIFVRPSFRRDSVSGAYSVTLVRPSFRRDSVSGRFLGHIRIDY